MFVRSFLSTVFLVSMLVIVSQFGRNDEMTASGWIAVIALGVAVLLFCAFFISPVCNAITVRRWYSTAVFVPSLALTLYAMYAAYVVSYPGTGGRLLMIAAGILGLYASDELRSVYDRQKVKVTKK